MAAYVDTRHATTANRTRALAGLARSDALSNRFGFGHEALPASLIYVDYAT
jgi:hypothetical protein